MNIIIFARKDNIPSACILRSNDLFMISISPDILEQYDVVLKRRGIPASRHADYKKWLRYFLDYCGKYSVPASKSDQVRLFVEKLCEKKQSTYSIRCF